MERNVTSSISVIIPNRNGAATIGKCLAAALASRHDNFEVIVVDDGSEDDSGEVIKGFPCRLIRLAQHGGAPARTGADQISAVKRRDEAGSDEG